MVFRHLFFSARCGETVLERLLAAALQQPKAPDPILVLVSDLSTEPVLQFEPISMSERWREIDECRFLGGKEREYCGRRGGFGRFERVCFYAVAKETPARPLYL